MSEATAATAPQIPPKRSSPWPLIIGFAIAEVIVIALGIGPWLTDHHRKMGREYARAGQYDKAIYHYQKLLEKYPDAPTIEYELGLVYLKSKHYAEAAEKLRGVIAANERESSNPPAGIHTQLGLALLNDNHYPEAMDEFKEAVGRDAKDPVASFYIGEELFRQKQNLLAASYLERAAFDPVYGQRAQSRLREIERIIFGNLSASATSASAPVP